MGYNVYVVEAACEHCGRGATDTDASDRSITRNVSPLVNRCLSAGGAGTGRQRPDENYSWWRLDGWPAAEALPIVDRASAEAHRVDREEEFRALELGDGASGLDELRRYFVALLEALRAHPKGTIRVSG